ncbi:MAG TPA: hypothetical protein DEO88_15610 [Syntrophobacteraceae bacterium]|nr:hypothetical protein [Syntrophobacteraceae bacterium]
MEIRAFEPHSKGVAMREALSPHVAVIIGVFPWFFSPAISSSTSLEEEVRIADQSFNRGDTAQALTIYRRMQQTLEKGKPIEPLRSEVINNIAAAYLVEGNLLEFQRHFGLAKSLKQEYGKQGLLKQTKKSPGQLLINGGFEDGLVFPWGTGHWESSEGRFRFGIWWNSKNARAFMKIDQDERHSGQRSLRITNFSPAAPHVFTTVSQRISGLKPNTIYRVSCFAKAQDLAPGAVSFAIDADWGKRLPSLPAGTYDWQEFSSTINIGHNDYIDFRILHQSTGTMWLDDIEIRELESREEPTPLQKVESLYDMAEYDEALKLCLELEKKYREDQGVLRHVRLYLGRIQQVLGDYDKAMEAIKWAVTNGLSRGNIDLARTYYLLGDYETAKETFLKSYEVVKGDQGTESLVLHELSRCQLALSQLDEALASQRRSYHILKHIENRHGQALSLSQLGEIHQRLHDNLAARDRYMEALTLARQLQDRKLESDILINLASCAYQQNQAETASQYTDQALRLKESTHDSLGLVRALHVRGRLMVARGDLTAARESYQKAISLLEEISRTISDVSRDAKATFLKQFNQLYREYVELLLRLYQKSKSQPFQEEAFRIVEQARSRVFTEMMTEARAMRSFAESSPGEFGRLLEQERRLTLGLHLLHKQLLQATERRDTAQIQSVRGRLENEEAQLRAVRTGIEKTYPRFADLRNPKPLQVQDVQSLLGADEAVLSYFVTSGLSGLWAITRDKVEFKILPMTRGEIIQRSERFRHGFVEMAHTIGKTLAEASDERFRAVFSDFACDDSHQLYRLLVLPVEPLIRSKAYVFLALDDLLYKLPFETLLTEPFTQDLKNHPIPGDSLSQARFWVKTHNLSYLPSLSVLRSLRTWKKATTGNQAPLLAFADPMVRLPGGKDAEPGGAQRGSRSSRLRTLQTRSVLPEIGFAPLPDAREEALQVARVLEAPVDRYVYLQDRATEANLKSLPLNTFRNLLFATHGLLAGEFGPGTQPALVFSSVNDPENDGLLEMGEILGLDFNADLAVLSACNTASGSGEEDRGEGFAGLTRSFMYAGARSLLVTEWSVESTSARTLVQTTFSKIKEGHPKAEALAMAKREAISSNALISYGRDRMVSIAHPFFWAPYVLVGETR